MTAAPRSTIRNGAEATDDGESFVTDYLLYLMAAASHATSSEFHDEIRGHGIRVPEWRVLACLHDSDGQMVTLLAELALMEQSRMTKIIDQMALKSLVYRDNDRADRRRVRIFLTDEGRRIARELVSAARAHEARIVDRLPPGAARQLKNALKSINALYQKNGKVEPQGIGQSRTD